MEPKNFLPFNNRTIRRMITVASGTFILIEAAGAATRAAAKNKGIKGNFTCDFLLNINYFGIGRFAFACAADAKYIADDFKKAFKAFTDKHKSQKHEEADYIPGLGCLVLNERQAKILFSLKLQKILYDIQQTKSEKSAAAKQTWMHEWEKITLNILEADNTDYFIRDGKLIYDYIRYELLNSPDTNWPYLIAMELSLFKPYYPLNTGHDKEFKGLQINTSYESEVFCQKQDAINPKDLELLLKTYHKNVGILNNNTRKAVAGIAVTAAATLATAGLAWAFAPQLAVLVAGESVAGLSGAALTSASLAMVGGGALAAGGLGMAGGTVIITGGGALLGIASPGAVSLSSFLILSSKGYALNECAKLLTFCKYVLINQHGKKDIVRTIQENVGKCLHELEHELESLNNEPKDKAREKLITECKRSFKYIKRCNAELLKLSE